VQFTSTSNDVLTGLVEGTLYHRIGLGETLKTFDQLGEIVGVLGLDGNTHDRGHGELHDTNVVSLLVIGDGTRLQQVLIDSNQTDGVTAGDVLNRFDVTTHHQNGTLNVLDEKISLLARNVVGAHDADLGTSAYGSGEDTTEGVETSLIAGGYHLGDVQHERTRGVAVPDGGGTDIIHRTFVQVLNTILLGNDGRGEMVDNHVKEGLSSGQPLPHHSLEEGLGIEILLVGGELDSQRLNHLGVLVLLSIHDRVEQLVDGLQDKLHESSLASSDGSLGPFTGLGVEIVVAPQVLQHLVSHLVLGIFGGLTLLGSRLELSRIHVGELVEGETPLVETGSEGDGSLVRVDGNITEEFVLVSGDDDVDGLNGPLESLVGILRVQLELQEGTVHLVDHEYGFDTLTQSLTKYGFSLYTNSFDAIYDDEGTIGDTKSGSNLRGKVDVPRGIDKIDQESVSIGTHGKLLVR